MSVQSKLSVAIVALAGLLSGCASSMVPFSHELRTQHDLSDDDVGQLQFYVSHEVTLRRDAVRSGRSIDDGRLTLKRGKKVQQVVIRQETPGVALKVEPDAIVVSFQEGSSLKFSLRTGRVQTQPLRQLPRGGFAEAPDAFPGVVHHNDDDELLGSYFLETQDDTQVQFQGKFWEAVAGSFSAHLMIDAESLEEVVETKEVLDGREISSL